MLRHRSERMRPHRASEEGVTLIETLAVVVVVGLMAAVTAPNVGAFFRAYRIRVASDQVVGHLRAARQLSVTQRVPVTLTINPSPQNDYTISYTIPGEATTNETFSLAEEIGVTTFPSGALTFTLNQNGTVGNPTTPDAENPTANYLRLTRVITAERTDQYTITALVTGTIDVEVVR